MADEAADETLLVSQKNQVFRLAMEEGLDTDKFRWEETLHGSRSNQWKTSTLRFGAEYFCEFRIGHSWGIRCSPGEYVRFVSLSAGSWNVALIEVKRWLSWLRRETEPDLWASMASGGPELFYSPPLGDDNSAFSSAESKRIQGGVQTLSRYLRDSEKDPERLRFIDERLSHMADAAQRLGRKDWTTLALGVLAQIAVGLAMAPDTARELFRVAAKLFEWVFTTPPLIP